MASPYKQRVLAFNKKRKAEGEKASDMEIIASKLAKLPPGQLKKLLDDETVTILAKYGVEI